MPISLPAAAKLAYYATIAASLLWTAGMAAAAGTPPANPPATPAATQSAPQSQPIPLNSGVAPQEFEADAGKVTMERLSDGTRLYHMNGQGMQSLVAHLGADGKIEYTCTDKVEQIANGAAENAHEQ
jgi:hypothetical protein